MEINVLLWILGGMQAITLLLLGWIKRDITDLWKRADSHGHVVTCPDKDCHPKATSVTLS